MPAGTGVSRLIHFASLAFMVGLRLVFPYSLGLTIAFVAPAGALDRRVYSGHLRHGWT